MNFQIQILNPKAEKLLRDLADMQLISISEPSVDSFLAVVDRLRKNAESDPPNLDDITKEVEKVRSKRYAKNKS